MTRSGIAVCGVVLTLSLTGWVRADDANDSSNDVGKAMYRRYCGACHGPGGKGDGVASSFMQPKPIDLTQIAKRNGGEFPMQRIAQVIDGTNTPRAHGDPDMPVWGEVLRAETTQRAEAQGKILLITNFLRSIQEK